MTLVVGATDFVIPLGPTLPQQQRLITRQAPSHRTHAIAEGQHGCGPLADFAAVNGEGAKLAARGGPNHGEAILACKLY